MDLAVEPDIYEPSIDDNGNPTFNESFSHKLEELKHNFVTNPIDITKENFTEEEYIIAENYLLTYLPSKKIKRINDRRNGLIIIKI